MLFKYLFKKDCVGGLWLGRDKMGTRGLSFPYFTRLQCQERGLRQTLSCLVLSVENCQLTATFLGFFLLYFVFWS